MGASGEKGSIPGLTSSRRSFDATPEPPRYFEKISCLSTTQLDLLPISTYRTLPSNHFISSYLNTLWGQYLAQSPHLSHIIGNLVLLSRTKAPIAHAPIQSKVLHPSHLEAIKVMPPSGNGCRAFVGQAKAHSGLLQNLQAITEKGFAIVPFNFTNTATLEGSMVLNRCLEHA